jgi:pilus assembly protein CpaE
MAEEKKSFSILIDIKSKGVLDLIKDIISNVSGVTFYEKASQFESQESYDLLILETGEDPNKDLQFANTLKTSETVRDIFLTSSNKNPDILIEALRIGVKEFFGQPIKKDDIRSALLKVKAYKDSLRVADTLEKNGKIINVLGTKGGVGTTTVAINLAVSLTELEGSPSVVLVDLKPVFGEIAVNLNVEPTFSWLEVIKNITRLDATYLMSIITRHSSGVFVLPAPVEFTEDYMIYPQALATLLKLMRTMFDYIVIDSGQSLDENSWVVLKSTDSLVLVFVLNLPCIINLKRLLNTLTKQHYQDMEKVEIVVNRVHKNTDITIKDAEVSLQKKILCGIPNAYKLSMNAINEGKPLYSLAKGTEIWAKFRELASAISERAVISKQDESVQKKKSSFPFVKGLFS